MMRSAFEKGLRETRRENRLIRKMITESEKPRLRPDRNPYAGLVCFCWRPPRHG